MRYSLDLMAQRLSCPLDLGVVKSGRRPKETCMIIRLTGLPILVGRNWRSATFISTLPYSVP